MSILVFRLQTTPVECLAKATYPAPRSRKPHRKSRLGCANCKSRRVKCDEGKPRCSTCTSRNEVCSFAKGYSQSPGDSAEATVADAWRAIVPANVVTISTSVSEAASINESLTQGGAFKRGFAEADLDLLRHFERFTSTTIGDEQTQNAYRAIVPRLATEYPYLMHAILAMSVLHSQYLKGRKFPPARYAVYHWQQCLFQFSKHVAPSIRDEKADAMLITSTLINGLAFILVNASSVERCWPLSSSPEDLQWVSVQGGIDLIFRATYPLSDSSKIRELFSDVGQESLVIQPTPQEILRQVPRLAALCDIMPGSNSQTNIYFAPLQSLTPLMAIPCTPDTVLLHLGFITSLDARYLSLLREKDHRALLILSCWYGNICTYDCWWTSLRSRIECLAICTYLDRNADDSITSLLDFPAKACGYRSAAATEAQTFIPCTTM
jgi:Fungal Zn(2)-Cys(6) binuclear cluster domain/Fungal specific transcription factor domain